MKTGGDCKNTDITTAKAAYSALQDFFTKFSELRANAFFITGESYAGVYCPTLADQIVRGNAGGSPKINLVGMAVGDPCAARARTCRTPPPPQPARLARLRPPVPFG